MAVQDRSIDFSNADAPSASQLRKTYLFYIGVDRYQHLTDLSNAVRDAEAVAEMLTTYYNCEIADFALPLLNEEATRSHLFQRFRALTSHFKKQPYQDNLLIYFAGHGEWDEVEEQGYWALHGAQAEDYSSYFSNANLVQKITAIRSHHTLIISDSCFSGGLIETSRRRSNRKDNQRSRYVLASGLKDETVSDGEDGTHSPFAHAILGFLTEQKGKSIKVREIEAHIEQYFESQRLNQEPIFAPLPLKDNEYGELILRPRFDVLQELERLISAGNVSALDPFIQNHQQELRTRGKLTHANDHLAELLWQEAEAKNDGFSYLAYLDRFLRSRRNSHREAAIRGIEVWMKDKENALQEAEEDLTDMQLRYEKARKELKQIKENHKQQNEQTKELAELKEENEQLKEELKTLPSVQKELEQVRQERDELKVELKAKKQELKGLSTQASSIPIVKPRTELPTFNFPVPEMVFVKGGTFMMGDEDTGQFQVTLDDFYMGKYPVTQYEWQAIMGFNPSFFKSKNNPVEKVSWEYCQKYIQKLNEKSGLIFRLPNEAEWEYAAGGGEKNRTVWAGTSLEDELINFAWFRENSGKSTQAVGQKQPNGLELYDMSGNVYEWCNDWYSEYPSNPSSNPRGPVRGSNRVLRGGNWYDDARYCRISFRNNDRPERRFNFVGFRLALSP